MKNKHLSLIIILVYTQLLFSNNVSGIVIDNDSKIPIALTNIYIRNTSLGTISNEDGQFKIHIPKIHADKIIVFSCIGYEVFEISIQDISNSKAFVVNLKKSVTKLEEVILFKKKLSGLEIVQNAFKKHKVNFPNTPFLSKGFFRYRQRSLKEYKWLIEGTFDYYDEGYNSPIENILVDVKELRQSIDGREVDTSSIYYSYLTRKMGLSSKSAFKKSQLWNKAPSLEIQKAILFNDQNYLQNLKNIFENSVFNPIRNYSNSSSPYFKHNFFEKHTFIKDSTFYMGDQLIYKIKILPNKKNRKILKNYGKSLLPIGYIFINTESFKIIEMQYDLIYDPKRGRTHIKFDGVNYRNSVVIKFKEVQEKMIPYYIHIKYPVSFVQNFSKIVQIQSDNRKGDLQDAYYIAEYEFLLSETILNKNKIASFIKDKIWNPDIFERRPFNAKFWKNYNILLETKEQQKLIKDLEKKISLKKQFEQQ